MAFANIPDHVDLPEEAKRAFPFGTTTVIQGNLRADFTPTMTTTLNPSQYITDDEGSALLIFNDGAWGCSGTLIDDNKILTASHCVAGSNGEIDAVTGTAYFGNVVDTTGYWDFDSDFEYTLVEFIKHPKFDGKFEKGYDIAVVKISQNAHVSIPQIGIDTDDGDTIGQEITVHGYGISGLGETGHTTPFGTLRSGENKIDDYADTMMNALGYKGKRYVEGSTIQSDFDNGKSENDAFGKFFNIKDTGSGDSEVKVCSGDSGGSIRNDLGLITGVNSYTIRLQYTNGDTSDIDSASNCSFGEFTGYANVPFYADWLTSIINDTPQDDGSNKSGGPPACRGRNC